MNTFVAEYRNASDLSAAIGVLVITTVGGLQVTRTRTGTYLLTLIYS